MKPIARSMASVLAAMAVLYGSTTPAAATGTFNLPAPSTFTLTPQVYTNVYVWNVAGSTTIASGVGVTFYRTTFALPPSAEFSADAQISVDNSVQIFINGHELALEGNIDWFNFFGLPHHRIFVGTDGTVTNGYLGGDSFDRVASSFPSSNWVSGGENELILAVRNYPHDDSGGFSFLMTIGTGAAPVTVASNTTDWKQSDADPNDPLWGTNPYGGDWWPGVTSLSSNQAPDVSGAVPSIASIWPPNNKMVDIAINGVTDPDGDTVTITIDSITNNETGTADAAFSGSTAQVRAARNGKGSGRTYTISFTAADGKGGSTSGSVQVVVPHDQGKRAKPTAVESATWGEVKHTTW